MANTQPASNYKKHLHDGLPFSEDQSKFKETFSADDCIKELNILVEEYPDKVITRNFFS